MSNKIKLSNPEELGLSSAQLNRIEQHLHTQYIEKGKISGCSTLVARAGKVCYFKQQGLSDIERQTPMTENTLFRIYSMFKCESNWYFSAQYSIYLRISGCSDHL